MKEQQFLIDGRTYMSDDPALQHALARIHDTPARPLCMCAHGGIEMYVAKHRLYVVKRMPCTGHLHDATCASYEPEYGQSGLGELMGQSIIERSPESVELRVDFPLARAPGRTVVRNDRSRYCRSSPIGVPRPDGTHVACLILQGNPPELPRNDRSLRTDWERAVT